MSSKKRKKSQSSYIRKAPERRSAASSRQSETNGVGTGTLIVVALLCFVGGYVVSAFVGGFQFDSPQARAWEDEASISSTWVGSAEAGGQLERAK